MSPSARPVVGAAALGLAPELRVALEERADIVVDPAPTERPKLDAMVASPFIPADATFLADAPRIAAITHIGTALHTDVDAATRLGVPVLHNPGANADSVAEHTIALMLAVVKRIVASDAEVHARAAWDVAARHLVTTELRGHTLGVVGFGAVGRRVAQIASTGFGMEVAAWTRRPGLVGSAGYLELPLDDVLRRCDVLTVHVAATAETNHLIDRRRLELLRPNSWLINTARAEVIDYVALAELLRAGRLVGAALDTWPGHHGDPASPLLDVPNLVLTQHNAGLTHEALARMARCTAGGLWQVLAGTRPMSSRLANPQVWTDRRTPHVALLA
jgi:D-3-phosphoglycerate dehydrogenase / 2-oxoglutarate reductase